MAERAPPSDGRRRHERFTVEAAITLESEHNFYAGLVENLSASGVFIATHTLRPIGEHVEFSIQIGDSEEPITGVGEVRWIREYSETSDTPPGLGLKFLELDPVSLARLEEFLKARAPLLFDDD
jgi:uncharacterized protein (TIGR02266 family)